MSVSGILNRLSHVSMERGGNGNGAQPLKPLGRGRSLPNGDGEVAFAGLRWFVALIFIPGKELWP